MVTEISPTYYAAGRYKLRFVLRGAGFDAIPDDAVAVPSQYNDRPLVNRNVTDPDVLMVIESRTENEIVFSAAREANLHEGYLGSILSNDRETIYWVNETKPLP